MAECPVMQAGNTGPSPETALNYLPYPEVQLFDRGEQIYGPEDAPANLYQVREGRVNVSRVDASGVTMVVGIYQAGDFFGESALVNAPTRAEQAVALEPAQVNAWSVAGIARQMESEPRLAQALMQVMAARCQDFAKRLESLSAEGTAQRLGRALVHFADRESGGSPDSEITIAPLTHEVLAHYVGTSREMVSHQMSEFRRQGYIRYSRKGISVQRDDLGRWLRQRTQGG
jgi:CRP/FNR family cyclic AMP-dependent transcriptional regulator